MIKSGEVFSGRATSRPMVAIAWLPGRRYKGHLNTEALGFITWNCLAAHLKLGGCGHRGQMRKGLGLAFLLLFLIRPGISSMLQLMP